jgi:hypothetical protein
MLEKIAPAGSEECESPANVDNNCNDDDGVRKPKTAAAVEVGKGTSTSLATVASKGDEKRRCSVRVGDEAGKVAARTEAELIAWVNST